MFLYSILVMKLESIRCPGCCGSCWVCVKVNSINYPSHLCTC